MDYLKTVVPSQLMAERGSNLVVINPGSANVRIGLAHQHDPFSIPHCIARHVKNNDGSARDQMLNSVATPAQHLEREKAYDIIASLLKISFLDEEAKDNPFQRKMGRADGYNPPQIKSDASFSWTNVTEKIPRSLLPVERPESKVTQATSFDQEDSSEVGDSIVDQYKEYLCGEDALRINPSEPYSLCRPIRRGHFNISQHYPLQQVLEDLYIIWDWILSEKVHVLPADRNKYSCMLVVPETFDTREIKEMISIIFRDLGFTTAVVHQEGLAAAFGNGLSTACVVNIGAHSSSVICIEDGVALPLTSLTMSYGGEDISRCLLWVQRHHQTWPVMNTNPFAKPVDLLMLNRIKEIYCQIREGEFDAVAIVNSFEEGKPVGSHKTRLSALNVPPMGLFYPKLFVPEEYPPPPRSWFRDYEDMLVEDAWHPDYSRRPDMADGLYYGGNGGLSMGDNYPVFASRLKKEENIGLAEAIARSILSTGRIDLQRKLFCSIQLIGGVALMTGLVGALEERVLHAIPSNEAIDTVEVLPLRGDPSFVSWRGGAILGVLDYTRDAWIHREDWIRSGIHIGSGRKYKDSYYLHGQALCYMNC